MNSKAIDYNKMSVRIGNTTVFGAKELTAIRERIDIALNEHKRRDEARTQAKVICELITEYLQEYGELSLVSEVTYDDGERDYETILLTDKCNVFASV